MSIEHGSKIIYKFKVRYLASCTTAKVMKHQTRRGNTLRKGRLSLHECMFVMTISVFYCFR